MLLKGFDHLIQKCGAVLPISIKCILSSEPLVEDERLQEELILTQKDIKLIRKLNMFAVEQF